MTAFIAAAAVIIFILCILLVPLKLRVGLEYNSDGIKSDFAFYYGFIRIRTKKGKKNNDAADTQEENKTEEKDKKPAVSPSGIIRFVSENVSVIKNLVYDTLKYALGKGIRIKKLDINLAVGTDDAMDTALAYGTACSLVYGIAGFIDRHMHLEGRKIKIKPDFNNAHIYAAMKVIITTNIFKLVPVAVIVLKSGKRLKNQYKVFCDKDTERNEENG